MVLWLDISPLFFSAQVDKGVVPLAGTNGETTTQGEFKPLCGGES